MRHLLIGSLSAALALGACSKDETFVDASVGDDVDIDASVGIDATPAGTVHVTTFVRNGGLPDARFANAEILVFGLDGTLRDRDQTDSNGEATVDVVSGDSVTAIYDIVADTDVYLTTIAGVKPGDDLSFGDEQHAATTGTVTGSMTVTWPALTSANAVYLVDNCGTRYYPAPSDTSVTINHTDACHPATLSAVLWSQGPYPTYATLEWGSIDAATFTDAGTVAITTLSPPMTFSVDFTNLSPEIDDEYDVYANGVIGDAWVGAGSTNLYLYPDNGTASGTQPGWVPSPDGVITSEYLYRQGSFGAQYDVRRHPAGTTSLTTPMTPLPWLAADVIAVIPARTIQWFQLGTAPYDAAKVEFGWSVGTSSTATSGAHLGSGGSTSFDWNIYLPPGTTGVAFPELPEDLAIYAPPSDTTIYPYVELMDSDAVDGYDAFRALPEWTMDCLDCVPASVATFPTVRTSYGGSDKPRHHVRGTRLHRAPVGASARR